MQAGISFRTAAAESEEIPHSHTERRAYKIETSSDTASGMGESRMRGAKSKRMERFGPGLLLKFVEKRFDIFANELRPHLGVFHERIARTPRFPAFHFGT